MPGDFKPDPIPAINRLTEVIEKQHRSTRHLTVVTIALTFAQAVLAVLALHAL